MFTPKSRLILDGCVVVAFTPLFVDFSQYTIIVEKSMINVMLLQKVEKSMPLSNLFLLLPKGPGGQVQSA